MVFSTAAGVPDYHVDGIDSITLQEFVTNEKYGRCPHDKSGKTWTCGITGKTFTSLEVGQRTLNIAKAISKRVGWKPNDDLNPWEKMVCIYSLNTVGCRLSFLGFNVHDACTNSPEGNIYHFLTGICGNVKIDYMALATAVHRLNGIVTPASAAYSSPELEYQLKATSATVIFTCIPLLENALKAAKNVGISRERIFVLDMPGFDHKVSYPLLSHLIVEGSKLPELEPLHWVKGQGARQVAFICFSSGTSGFPKGVMLSHANIITNVLAFCALEKSSPKQITRQVTLGLLPLSHIMGLMMIGFVGPYRGDELVVLSKFTIDDLLEAIERFKIERLPVVPPIAVELLSNRDKCRTRDLSSVKLLYTGAAPMGPETIKDIETLFPTWAICQGYGMTETGPVVCSSVTHDRDAGSSGLILPRTKCKIWSFEGKEITDYDVPGELLVQSPSVCLGYLNNEKATAETFIWHDDGRWIKTGDEAMVRKSSQGTEHIYITDRIKELIKVKGHQVAPAELEAHLLAHEYVNDCAIIQVPHPRSGEIPKAYVVKSPQAKGKDDDIVVRAIHKHVEDHKAQYKWLKGGIEFADSIPKSPSGKILRRLLRDKEKAERAKNGARL